MWRISVFSVVIDADGRWVQLALFGPSRLNLLLRLNKQADVRDVMDALESRLSQPNPEEGSVVIVTSAGDEADGQFTQRDVPAYIMCTPASLAANEPRLHYSHPHLK
jgi:hypothetical protein